MSMPDSQLIEIARIVQWGAPVLAILLEIFVISRFGHRGWWLGLTAIVGLVGVAIIASPWSFCGVTLDAILLAIAWFCYCLLVISLLQLKNRWLRYVLIAVAVLAILPDFSYGWNDGLYAQWNQFLVRREWVLEGGLKARLHDRPLFHPPFMSVATTGPQSVEVVKTFGPFGIIEKSVSYQRFGIDQVLHANRSIVDVKARDIGPKSTELRYVFGFANAVVVPHDIANQVITVGSVDADDYEVVDTISYR
jgi:hypothetical protein